MEESFFKYKGLSYDSNGNLDARAQTQVIGPIVDSYYFLPSREKLNDPNEGVFQNQLQISINSFLQGVTGLGERNALASGFYELARQVSQSTDKSGVFSLSRNASDELMWAHYGSSHSGIVIEYDLALLTRFSSQQHLHCFDVQYSDAPPPLDILCLQAGASNPVRRILGHKSPRWAYEEEFRVVIESTNGKIPHDYRAVRSITFGLRVPQKVREAIFESTKGRVREYFEMILVPGAYMLQRRQLESFKGSQIAGNELALKWDEHFNDFGQIEREELIQWGQATVNHDPHFRELTLADRSSADKSQVVLQYQAQHHLGLASWTEYTKHYRQC